MIKELGRANIVNQVVYCMITAVIALILFRFVDVKFLWIYVVLAVILGEPIKKMMSTFSYRRIISRLHKDATTEEVETRT